MESGFYNVLKPTGMTSSDVVVQVRAIARRTFGKDVKVGHFGTLDPAGTGVLPIAVGRATRLFDYAVKERKIYRAGFVFGTETDTLDSYGTITKTSDKIPNLTEIVGILPQFIGDIVQIPPQYSSKCVDGKRAYDLAREGKPFELAGRPVTVYGINFIEMNGNSFVFDIECSGGTYIRSLVRDIADALGTVGYMSFIIRLQAGVFKIENAATIRDISLNPQGLLTPLDLFICTMPKVTVFGENAVKVINGVKIKIDSIPNVPFCLYADGELLGIGENDNGCIKVATRLL